MAGGGHQGHSRPNSKHSATLPLLPQVKKRGVSFFFSETSKILSLFAPAVPSTAGRFVPLLKIWSVGFEINE